MAFIRLWFPAGSVHAAELAGEGRARSRPGLRTRAARGPGFALPPASCLLPGLAPAMGAGPSSLSRGGRMHSPTETAASSGDTPGTWIRVDRGSTLRTLPAWDRDGHLWPSHETPGVSILNPAFRRLPSRLPPRAEDSKVEGQGPGTGQAQGAGGNKCLRAALGPPGDSAETRPRWGAGLHCLIRLRNPNSGTKSLRISRCGPQSIEPRALTRAQEAAWFWGAAERFAVLMPACDPRRCLQTGTLV